LYSAFEGVDVVFHTAAADPSKNDLQLHYKVNVEGEYLHKNNPAKDSRRKYIVIHRNSIKEN